MATCKGFLDCLLKLPNFLITLVGLAVVGYGIYLFVEYRRTSSDANGDSYGHDEDEGFTELGRALLMAVSLGGVDDNLSRAWFIYESIGVGIILLVISCFGCIVCILGQALILLQLGLAAFLYFDERWKDEILRDKTGDFDTVYTFLKDHWDIARWVALGVALVFLLALAVNAANRTPEYDSDEEYTSPRQQIRQPMLNKPPATGIPVGNYYSRCSTSQRRCLVHMHEGKVWMDSTEFTYDPWEANRIQPVPTQPTEGRSLCTIM